MNFGKCAVLGDSYSTFKGYIPEGNAVYYSEESTAQKVTTVEATWWHRLITDTGSSLVINESSSGATICRTMYGNYTPDMSFFDRARKNLGESVELDTLFILGGTNDSWGESPIGEVCEKAVEDYTDEELRCVFPATAALFTFIRDAHPKTRVCVVLNELIVDSIKDEEERLAKKNGFDVIRLHDVEMEGGHPTDKGMAEIERQILAFYA